LRPAAKRVLKDLAADADCDVLCDRNRCCCGTRPVARRVIDDLLRLLALDLVYNEGDIELYHINDTGLSLLRRPELEHELHAVLIRQTPFSVVNDRVVSV
jgi:hypothetical protein